MSVNLLKKEGETKPEYRARMIAALKYEARQKRKQISSGAIPVVMDVDDFGFLMPGFDDLLALKKSFPDFKITCFTIPLPKEFYQEQNAKQFSIEKYKKWATIVNEMDWIEVAVHGFSHVHNEMEVSYEKATDTLKAMENLFAQMGLKYSKIFKAPYWQYSYDALVALRDRGYTVAIDRNHERPVPDGLKTYIYNWSFEETLPETPIIKGHGHFTGNNTNNIGDTLANILHHLPGDAKFMTIGEYMECPACELEKSGGRCGLELHRCEKSDQIKKELISSTDTSWKQ